jgi:transposase
MANQIKVAISGSIHVLRQQGWSFRKIARTLHIHRETVARHLQLAGRDPKPATNLSTGSETQNRPKPANLSTGKSGPRSLCEPYRQVIIEKLDQGLSATRIWQDLASERGFAGRYASVKRFVRQLGRARPLPFRRMECNPGEEAQVDFAAGAPVEQPNGRAKRYPVLRVVLSHSRKGYSQALPRQGTEEFLRALENAFHSFGGVPRTLVIDNLKAAVVRADWYDPEIHPKLQTFCRHYGCVILPAKPYTPRHKGKVEAGVKYMKHNALDGKSFVSISAENEALQAWEANVADLRIHGTTKQQVKALFERERLALLPLPPSLFPCFHEASRVVSRDAHVEIEKAYYSVPPEYLGHTVWARWDATMVRIFNDRMELIAMHPRGEAGRFRTDPRHIASEKISGVERGAAYLLKRISLIGPETLRWAKAMLDARGIEGVRVLMGLLSMTGKYRSNEMEKACALAITHGAYRLRALRQLLEKPTRQVEFLDAHPLIRPMDFYAQRVRVSFRKEDNNKSSNGEFIALQAASGLKKEEDPDVGQVLSAVQPPDSALGSLSSGALSSGPARGSLPTGSLSVNSLERTPT